MIAYIILVTFVLVIIGLLKIGIKHKSKYKSPHIRSGRTGYE